MCCEKLTVSVRSQPNDAATTRAAKSVSGRTVLDPVGRASCRRLGFLEAPFTRMRPAPFGCTHRLDSLAPAGHLHGSASASGLGGELGGALAAPGLASVRASTRCSSARRSSGADRKYEPGFGVMFK